MVKIFADHCVGKFFIEPLRQSGADVLTASNVGMERATDEEIFDYALAEKRILISFDRHFINIARFNIKLISKRARERLFLKLTDWAAKRLKNE